MTERATVQMMREEVDPADLQSLPFKEQYKNGFSVNTDDVSKALSEIDKAGADYRVHVWAINEDGDRYPAFINEGRDNGIGADGLMDMLSREGMSLPEAVEKYTFGSVKEEEIAFYQLEFNKEHHR